MLSMLVPPLRQLVKALLANESPRQIAVAVAIGVVLGLVPKGNLIAVGLATILFSLRVNRAAGLAAAAAASWLGAVTDGVAHSVGEHVLSIGALQQAYAALYDMPMGPWLGFNNTVVMGSLIIGLYIAGPVYLGMCLAVERWQPPAADWLKRRRATRWLLGVDLGSRLGVTE